MVAIVGFILRLCGIFTPILGPDCTKFSVESFLFPSSSPDRSRLLCGCCLLLQVQKIYFVVLQYVDLGLRVEEVGGEAVLGLHPVLVVTLLVVVYKVNLEVLAGLLVEYTCFLCSGGLPR